MSFRNHVLRQTKNVAHVAVTPSGSLRAYLNVRGHKRDHTEKDTQNGAERLIRWINQNHGALSNSGLLPDLDQLRHYTFLDIIERYKEHPAPKKNPKATLSRVDLTHLKRLAKDQMATISLADESLLVNAAYRY